MESLNNAVKAVPQGLCSKLKLQTLKIKIFGYLQKSVKVPADDVIQKTNKKRKNESN